MSKPEGVWVVAACFNEQDVITRFVERVLAVPGVDQLVLIDDGSSDATAEHIRAWMQSHVGFPVTLLELTRNFGKEAAMLAGLDHVNGRCAAAVLIDSDLQHPPELIEDMVRQWRAGAEVVTAVRDDQDPVDSPKGSSPGRVIRAWSCLISGLAGWEGRPHGAHSSCLAMRSMESFRSLFCL